MGRGGVIANSFVYNYNLLKLEKDIYHIASEYFKGSITHSDRAELLEWLGESEDNRILFKELENIWKLTGSLETRVEVDTEAEWNKFVQTRDDGNVPQVQTKHRFIPISTWKIAAVILPFILLSAFLYFKVFTAINWNTLSTTNTPKQFVLSDGTRIWLNKNSKLTYPDKFSNTERVVKLSGEAFFDVTKNGASFVIESDKVNVKVLGTSFNLRVYENETSSELYVKEGKVLFARSGNPEINSVTVKGEYAVLPDNGTSVIKNGNTNMNPVAWMEKRLLFENTPMSQVAIALQRYFQVDVKLPADMSKCLISGDFSKPQLTEMMDVICLTVGCEYQLRGNTLIFSGKGCN